VEVRVLFGASGKPCLRGVSVLWHAVAAMADGS
jgi:hypothetical protein